MLLPLCLADEVIIDGKTRFYHDKDFFSFLPIGSISCTHEGEYYISWDGQCKQKHNCDTKCIGCDVRVVDGSYCGIDSPKSTYPPKESQEVGQMCFPDQETCGAFFSGYKTQCKLLEGMKLDLWDPSNYYGMGSWFTKQATRLDNHRKTFPCMVDYIEGTTSLESMGKCYLDCETIEDFEYSCRNYESTFLCKNSLQYPSQCFNWNKGQFEDCYEFTCNIDDVVYCPAGCDLSSNQCNGLTPSEQVPECSEGYMRCGNNDIFDPEGSIQKCINGQWETLDECGVFNCIEETYNYARCKTDIYYCLNNLGDCSPTSKEEGCFKTKQECLDNKVFYCRLGKNSNICEKRLGGCGAGEIPFWATDEKDAERMCKTTIQCYNDGMCPDGFNCINGQCRQDESYIEPCADDDIFCKLFRWWENFSSGASDTIFWIVVTILVLVLFPIILGLFTQLSRFLKTFIPIGTVMGIMKFLIILIILSVAYILWTVYS